MLQTLSSPVRPGRIAVALTIAGIVIVAAAIVLFVWQRPTDRLTAPAGPTSTATEVQLPPAPDKVYDLSGTVTAVSDDSFTIRARLRTDKNTLRDAYRDATLTVRFDGATTFTKRGAFDAQTGQVPAATAATAGDLKVGGNVDVRSRGENVLEVESFMAAQVTIKQ